MARFEHVVTEKDTSLSIKEIVKTKFQFSSRLMSRIKRERLIFLNGEESLTYFNPQIGDVIKVILPEETSFCLEENIPLKILYEDEDFLVIDKQSDIVVHPTRGYHSHTISNGIMYHMRVSGQNFKIRFVNRLDKDTTGVLLVAKNAYVQEDIIRQMKVKNVEKRYLALVKGNLEEDYKIIDLPIGRISEEKVTRAVLDGGYPSITHCNVKNRFGNKYTLVELKLETGRTHQIRVHMSHIGHPVLGDYEYGGNAPLLIGRQALHSSYLSFVHPITKKMVYFESVLPEDMLTLCK